MNKQILAIEILNAVCEYVGLDHSRATLLRTRPAQKKIEDKLSDVFREIDTRDRLIEQLGEALAVAIQWAPTDVMTCQGAKCDEDWCYFCNGGKDAANAVDKVNRERLPKCRSVLAAYREWKESDDGHPG